MKSSTVLCCSISKLTQLLVAVCLQVKQIERDVSEANARAETVTDTTLLTAVACLLSPPLSLSSSASLFIEITHHTYPHDDILVHCRRHDDSVGAARI